jgi:YegS/Rv2252/BmrU family lipid kinase
MKVAVVAHRKKSLGEGLPHLRSVLKEQGIGDPCWIEVPKSKKIPQAVEQAVASGAQVLFVWGGDGSVQRAIDVIAGSDVTLAIVPAGTANLLATNLGVPRDIEQAVEVGLRGRQERLDVGVVNGERFAVMAGLGFDAKMIDAADRGLKDRVGKLAYVWTGAKSAGIDRPRVTVKIDGTTWFDDRASCVLIGNVGTILGGVHAFPDASPDDGRLDVGVVSAKGRWQWAKVMARLATGKAAGSKLVDMTQARKVDIRLDRAVLYQLDGGARKTTQRLKVHVEPGALRICLPDGERAAGERAQTSSHA